MEIGDRISSKSVRQNDHSANEPAGSSQRYWDEQRLPCRDIAAATMLFLQGQPPRKVYFVKRGIVKLTRLSENGQEIVVGLRSKGSLLGAASAIVREPYPATAVTLTNCSVSSIPDEMLLRLARTDERFCWYLHQVHSLEVHQQAGQLAVHYLSAKQRFVRLLLQFHPSISNPEKTTPHYFSQSQPTSIKIRLPLKHWEIAQLIGVTPEHLSRILKSVKQEGLVHSENGCMIISDLDRLACLGEA